MARRPRACDAPPGAYALVAGLDRRILATDVSEANSIYPIASTGRSRSTSFPPYLVKYFDRAGEEWRVKERVRAMVHSAR